MSPEQEQLLNEVNRKLEELYTMFRSPAEIDPQFADTITKVVGNIYLNDLKDVDTSGIANGQVIKYNSSTQEYEAADDIDT